ncbi:MAG: HAD-IA family hydrolase [Fimbriimonadales bacterium]|nr:HAD-IA family hydrolase [Fimbriimonadales bacterium]
MAAWIFDVDGVLVDSPHEAAWGETALWLAEHEWDFRPIRPYDTALYQAFVAGKPRLEGAAALLRALGIPDPDGAKAVRLAELKQHRILELIRLGSFRAFDDAVRLAARAKAAGCRLAAASSSKNANAMLERVDLGRILGPRAPAERLIELFDANVCGRDFPRGKPDPEIFLAAAREAAEPPASCVVVEDAPSGAAAAKAAGMACVGIARLGDEDLLRGAGADLVVSSLDDVRVGPDGLPVR